MRNLIFPALVMAAVACNKADFGSKDSKRNGASAVVPANGQVNPLKEPLDVSQIDSNENIAADGGPKAGTGEQLSRTIELTCDNQQGVEIEVGGGKATLWLAEGDESGYVEGKGKGDVKGGKGDTKGGGKGGKDIDVDVDGKPKGDPGTKGPGGKPDTDLPTEPPVDVPEAAKVVTTVRGQFCPTTSNKLTVLFVVDYSGSMGRHIPGQGLAEVPGNDPQINGSCGRLRAAEAILDKIAAEMRDGDTVEIGMVPFAGGIVTNRILDIRGLDEFRSQVSKDTFCQYVVQRPSFGYDPVNPGGIDGGAIDSSTNYKAAFTAARSALTGVYGRKVVYFISDGEPTSGGTDPVAAGVEAGRELRESIDNLTLNALLLGNVGPAAQGVLEQVAGAPERVRTADNADELADEILDFPEASIDEQSGRATLTVAPYPTEELGLHYLGQHPNQDNIWIYETQPFILLGKPGEEVLNVVEVTARGADGSTHSSIVKIRYRQ